MLYSTYLLYSTLELMKVVCGALPCPQTGEAMSEGTFVVAKPPTDDAGNEAPAQQGSVEAPAGLSARARAKRAFGASFSSLWCSSARASSVAPTAPLGEAVTPRRSLPLVQRFSDWCVRRPSVSRVRRPLSTLSERCPANTPSPLSDAS